MFRSRFACLLAALTLVSAMGISASAADVACDDVYCFSQDDFASEGHPVAGICVTGIPDSGAVMLGSRIIRAGDILTADQLSRLTFSPLWTRENQDAQVSYLPIFSSRVAEEAVMTIAIHGKEDQAPIAKDFTAETYKNLASHGTLQVSDPEGQKLTFTVTRQPKRGSVELKEDGTFLYTPKKNKVGVDSFTYTAADPGGNVSREATVTIQILRPADSTLYTDTAGTDCRFTAEWMKNTGIFSGEQVGSNACFGPEKTVTRGEFLTMTMKALDIAPEDNPVSSGFSDECAPWLKPYLAAALRSGIVSGYPSDKGPVFRADQNITAAEAASILRNALDLPSPVISEDTEEPTWAVMAMQSVHDSGIKLNTGDSVTRAQVANALYQASKLLQNDENQ